ncbi:MAG TPA: isoprenylcysteine carboxylmethyltransferase family protein [Bryobacteraceae bacterium]|nr:isoprenylcysteine carboxylmethyltransferase family protein [Bryobacteraceae bacterium]
MYSLALTELAVCWVLWVLVFVRRIVADPKRPSQVTLSSARWGMLLQALAYFVALSFRLPRQAVGPGRLAGSMICGPLAVALAWAAVRHLGKQWRLNAGLYPDHELVRTGPYRIVRHPIYASMLAIFLGMGLLITPWIRFGIALAVFLAGTEVRVQVEDGLLASRFGEEFAKYKRRVRAYVPLVR